MLIHLHSQATTTPKVRAASQASDEPDSVLAARFGTTEQTINKWRQRDSVEDRSHIPHRLQMMLTPAQDAVAVALRKSLVVSRDDLPAVVRKFLNLNAPRFGLSLPASARCGKPARSEGQGTEAEAQRLEGQDCGQRSVLST